MDGSEKVGEKEGVEENPAEGEVGGSRVKTGCPEQWGRWRSPSPQLPAAACRSPPLQQSSVRPPRPAPAGRSGGRGARGRGRGRTASSRCGEELSPRLRG